MKGHFKFVGLAAGNLPCLRAGYPRRAAHFCRKRRCLFWRFSSPFSEFGNIEVTHLRIPVSVRKLSWFSQWTRHFSPGEEDPNPIL